MTAISRSEGMPTGFMTSRPLLIFYVAWVVPKRWRAGRDGVWGKKK